MSQHYTIATYFTLSNFYFWFFALLGGLAPYFPLYFDHLGFSHFEIGVLSSILLVTKVIAPNLWSWLGDHTGHRLLLVRLGAFLSFLIFCSLLVTTSFWPLAAAIAGFSFFWNAVLPQYEVVTLYNLGEKRDRYSLVRVWGSVGFIATVYLLGFVFEVVSIAWLPWMLTGIIFFIWVSAMAPVHEEINTHHVSLSGFMALLKQPGVIGFFIMNLLLQVSHGPYYTFFSLYLDQLGYSKTLIGFMWALGVFAEVILFLLMRPLLARWSLKQLAIFALLITSLRWFFTAHYAHSLAVLVLAQVGHAASFGVMHIVAIHFVNEHFQGAHEGQGQALYSSLSFGLGGALGALASGTLADIFDFQTLFMLAGLVSLIAMLISFFSFTKSVRFH